MRVKFFPTGPITQLVRRIRPRPPAPKIVWTAASRAHICDELNADQVPALQGAMDLLAQVVASSLFPVNAAALVYCPQLEAVTNELLIDPQSFGPLWAAMPSANPECCFNERGKRELCRQGKLNYYSIKMFCLHELSSPFFSLLEMSVWRKLLFL